MASEDEVKPAFFLLIPTESQRFCPETSRGCAGMEVGHHGVPHSHPQVLQLLQTATANRSVARTALNDHLSRSHSIFQLRIDGTNTARELRCSCECGWGPPPPFGGSPPFLGLSFLLEPLPVPFRASPTPFSSL